MDLSAISSHPPPSLLRFSNVAHCSHRHNKTIKLSPKSVPHLPSNSSTWSNLLRSDGGSSSFYSSSRFLVQKRCEGHGTCNCTARFAIWACTPIGAAGSVPFVKKVSEFKDAFWRFLRPHTIRGTVLGSVALVSRALIENSQLINWWLLPKALCGLLALICGNGYIVGINQIYDIGIDKVNKPYLPIAAGDLSVQSAWFLVLLFAAAGLLVVGLSFGALITSLYCLGLFLGTIYSVPPLRLKRFPVVAFLIIATVRGFLLNFGVYYATRAALGLAFEWSAPVAFITAFVTLFALVIAITKDLPDVEGDRKFQISTFATTLGVRNIAFLGSGLLLANYLAAIFAAVYCPQAFRCSLMIPAHAILALALTFQAWILEWTNYTKELVISPDPSLPFVGQVELFVDTWIKEAELELQNSSQNPTCAKVVEDKIKRLSATRQELLIDLANSNSLQDNVIPVLEQPAHNDTMLCSPLAPILGSCLPVAPSPNAL